MATFLPTAPVPDFLIALLWISMFVLAAVVWWRLRPKRRDLTVRGLSGWGNVLAVSALVAGLASIAAGIANDRGDHEIRDGQYVRTEDQGRRKPQKVIPVGFEEYRLDRIAGQHGSSGVALLGHAAVAFVYFTQNRRTQAGG